MALDKNGMDLKAIRKDQKAIDKLPNKGRAFGKKREMAKKMDKQVKVKTQSTHKQNRDSRYMSASGDWHD